MSLLNLTNISSFFRLFFILPVEKVRLLMLPHEAHVLQKSVALIRFCNTAQRNKKKHLVKVVLYRKIRDKSGEGIPKELIMYS